MRNGHPRSILALLVGGLFALGCIGDVSPAAAFGMFGFGRGGGGGGGFARSGPGMGAGQMGRMPSRSGVGRVGVGRVGGGRVVDRPPSRGDGPSGHHPVGGVGISVGVGAAGAGGLGAGNGGSNNNGGGGGGAAAAAAQGNPPFVPDEVITAFAPGTTPQAINRMAGRYDLTRVESQDFPLIGNSLYRWRIGGRRSVANVVRALGSENIVANVQPNYIFTLQEDQAAAPAAKQDDSLQYALGKLQIEQAHRIATGKDVRVAVIDSTIDAKHADLNGSIVKSFDALGHDDNPHAHGTSIAGAIAAHGKIVGIAPGAQLLAVHAFDDGAGTAKGTSFAIDKGLQWAADNGARIINMSFAGPADPMLGRMLTAAYNKNIVLIAAAGNAGPQSEPLYPAADPDVIAVTATDRDDHVFADANRGRHIAVAAPGVDILALAPDDKYQTSTGTSIAAAHISGIAALLLERKPSLTPRDIRAILITTAKPLGPPRPDADSGAGLASAYGAVTWLDRKPAAPEAGAPATQAQQ
jgi:subtilisin family serine protease